MAHSPFESILQVSARKDLAEVGGGHNQKGVEFQRHWAVMRMFELEESGVTDYLFLFEAIQDVAELDSSIAPNAVRVYQVKKKDRNEWTWGDLTGLPIPKSGKPTNFTTVPLDKLQQSPIGKLGATLVALGSMTVDGYFISNAGCNIPLEGGGNAATALPSALCTVSQLHRSLLAEGFEKLRANGIPAPDLSHIHLQRVSLPVDAPTTYLVGKVHQFLQARSPQHAGQAQSLVEALLLRIAPLGAKTDSVATFEDLRRERGYSRSEFASALSDLQTVPDTLALLNDWIDELRSGGMSVLEVSGLRVAAARIYRQQLLGTRSDAELALDEACDQWLNQNEIGEELLSTFESACSTLAVSHGWAKKSELQAHFALRAIIRCVDPT